MHAAGLVEWLGWGGPGRVVVWMGQAWKMDVRVTHLTKPGADVITKLQKQHLRLTQNVSLRKRKLEPHGLRSKMDPGKRGDAVEEPGPVTRG